MRKEFIRKQERLRQRVVYETALRIAQKQRRKERIKARKERGKKEPVLSRAETRKLAMLAIRGKLHAPQGCKPNPRWRKDEASA